MSGNESEQERPEDEPQSGDAHEAGVPAQEPEPEYVGPDAYQPQIIDPPSDEPEPTAAEDEKPREPLLPPGTTVTVRYEGWASVARHGDHRFKRGEPVEVPSEVAEELLTQPGERFVILDPKE